MAPFNDRHSTHIQTDDTPTSGSTNFVTSGALHTALEAKANLSGATFTGDITTSVIKSANSRIDFDHSTVGVAGGSATPKLLLKGTGGSNYGVEFEDGFIQGRGTVSNTTGVASIHMQFVGGHVYFNHQALAYSVYIGGGATNDKVLTGDGAVSDDRMKFNETAFEEALPLISQMQVKRYQKTSHIMTAEEEASFERGEDGFANRVSSDGFEEFGHVSDIGVIAQELHTVLPTAVTVGTEVKEWKVKYDHLTCVAIKAIQELNATIASLEARIVALGG